MNLRMRITCLPALLALIGGAVVALPVKAQSQQQTGQPAGQSTAQQDQAKSSTEVASTEDDLHQRILLDRIDALEKRIAELEGKDLPSAPVPNAATSSPNGTIMADVGSVPSSPQDASAPAAQTPAPADQAPAATPPAPPTWSAGPIDFSGEIDGYYGFNFNDPKPLRTGATSSAGGPFGAVAGYPAGTEMNFLYNFDQPTNQFSLNMVKLGMAHSPDPVGFEVDFAYGDTMTTIRNVSNTTGFDEFIENAFISFKHPKAKGFEIDFGKFVTSAGAEVIESYANWNYSRSLLFSWAIPYYHFGFRTSWPMGKHWVGGFQLVNGWNNVVDNNPGKTLGGNATATYGKFSWTTNWYGGPENPGTDRGWRELFDTTLTVTPSPVVAFYVNYDYAWENVYNDPTGNYSNGTRVNWDGIAGAIHITPPKAPKWAFSGRYEWFSDPQGFALLGASLGSVTAGDYPVAVYGQRVQEFTITGEYKFLEGLMARAEYRCDFSNLPFFESGGPEGPGFPADEGLGNISHQQTVTIAFIAFFGPKR